jgi:alpha-L-fucosidase
MNGRFVMIAAMLFALLSAMSLAGAAEHGRNTAPTQEAEGEVPLAKPSAAQYAYHELERIMFIHFHPGTWHGVEYDDGKTDLREINPTKLDTDQWCEAAKSWDAKMILYVAKHCGGFCWWQTDTTEYSIKNTPYKDGKGDVLKEISDSCRKHGLKFGVYVYPGDPAWGAGIGSGGRTRDPTKQAAYNNVLRQQLTETWTRYGEITEAWFDGSCSIPIDDLVEKYLSDAVILQSPQATIRWVGNEAGLAPYPAWNSLNSEDLKTGLSTAAHGDPDGDSWAPLECDVPLYNHKWLWSRNNERLRRSLNDLLSIYYKSVGRGAVMLLNATPNTDGLIPAGDMTRYRELGAELERRFANPLARTSGRGKVYTLRFNNPTRINQAVIMEDYREGERIRAYILEARKPDATWETVNTGLSVGRKRIVMFEPVTATQVTLRITENVNEPLIRDFSVYSVDGDNAFLYEDRVLKSAVSIGAAATASDEHSPPFLAGRICDGNMSTRWATGSKWGTPEAMKPPFAAWIELDLGENKSVDSTAVVEGWDRSRRFQIEYRSNKAEKWKVALSGTALGGAFSQNFPEVTGRYWRLKRRRGVRNRPATLHHAAGAIPGAAGQPGWFRLHG